MRRMDLKVSCLLEGDRAIDFERLSMEFNAGQYRLSRSKQQAAMIGAAMLVMDATKQKCTAATGKRYPTLEELLVFAEVEQRDICNLLGTGQAGEDGQPAATSAILDSANGGSRNSA